MCGLFGYIGRQALAPASVDTLIRHSQQRGRDSSGLVAFDGVSYTAYRADFSLTRLRKKAHLGPERVFFGHSRLITSGLADNQPVIRNDVYVLHNGIVVNDDQVWKVLGERPQHLIDTEVIAAIVEAHLVDGNDITTVAERVLLLCKGVVACAVFLPLLGKLLLFSNNGSLYLGDSTTGVVFASESYPLAQIGCTDIRQVRTSTILDVPTSESAIPLKEWTGRGLDLVPGLTLSGDEEKLLLFDQPDLVRCTRCILPVTMPFIRFDAEGVCNYCLSYQPRNKPRPAQELLDLVAPYRRSEGNECIIPFSGGRDSCYALHLAINELDMRPVTYTYDWGMVTDLGRRNISRMCGELGVENIIVADDIAKKRDHIRRNLVAWLKSPHLGMVSILTAGDKHFFAHVETIKQQTGVGLNLWGINPLEVTHFKSGFLGVPPDFEEKRVYSHGARKQARYQSARFRAMLHSPGYFNRSLWDTLTGEYFRSFTEKTDYFHIFDYWRWDERLVEDALDLYDWERAPDTQATWRIGDGTAAFYNYIYYTAAGFSEHDTFRSNQVREGDLTRSAAIDLAKVENQPRYANIKWYLDVLGLDFSSVITTINSMQRAYEC